MLNGPRSCASARAPSIAERNMLIQEDSRIAPDLRSASSHRSDVPRAEAFGTELEVFREYLALVAQRELAPDVAAKVSASDLVQETFLAAGRDFGQFQGRSELELQGWLKGILRNLLANTRRHYRGTGKRQVSREKVRGVVGSRSPADPLDVVSSSATSPSGRAMRRERADALLLMITSLPDKYRQVIQWRHQEQLSFEAIAGRLGISTEAARKVWGRALLRLRAALGPGHDPR
jgi:RNA polymerase sigma-70 factor, ECF subfamily